MVARLGRVSFTLRSDAPGLRIFFQLHSEASSTSGLDSPALHSRSSWNAHLPRFLEWPALVPGESISGDTFLLSVKNGIPVSLTFTLRGHVEQYNGFELLPGSGYGMGRAFFAYSCSREIYWSSFESFCYSYGFYTGVVSRFEVSVEPD